MSDGGEGKFDFDTLKRVTFRKYFNVRSQSSFNTHLVEHESLTRERLRGPRGATCNKINLNEHCPARFLFAWITVLKGKVLLSTRACKTRCQHVQSSSYNACISFVSFLSAAAQIQICFKTHLSLEYLNVHVGKSGQCDCN